MLKPKKTGWAWYDVSWSISRAHTTPTPLETEEHWELLVKKAGKRRDETNVKLTVNSRREKKVPFPSYLCYLGLEY